MRTPSGRDCSCYYEDFNRGAEIMRCRVRRSPGSAPWRPKQCERCPVPSIEAANGSRTLELTLTVRRGPLGWGTNFGVEAWCTEHGPLDDPYVGCLECLGDVQL